MGEKGMIYFIQTVEGGPIKIGVTTQLQARLSALATAHSKDLRVLGVLDGERSVEKELHERFSHLRVKNEWFEPGEDLCQFIAESCKAWNPTREISARVTTANSSLSDVDQYVAKSTTMADRRGAGLRLLRQGRTRAGRRLYSQALNLFGVWLDKLPAFDRRRLRSWHPTMAKEYDLYRSTFHSTRSFWSVFQIPCPPTQVEIKDSLKVLGLPCGD